MVFKPRPMQQMILDYTSGKMGVSAVPGSGKTQTLSSLAAKLILEGYIADDQEILIVTLVNSAVDNFYSRVTDLVRREGLLPHMGYRVRTLHGLANDIIRQRPALVGLADNFQIVDEQTSGEILESAVEVWVRSNPTIADEYLSDEISDSQKDKIRRDKWPLLVRDIAYAVIRLAKDLRITPQQLLQLSQELPVNDPLLAMGIEVYNDYQRGLNYRGAVDYDDLIRLALEALLLDPEYLARLRHQWPFILEDEAQDSSRLQEEILRLLAGDDGNWVRVGDPNQAIYETFTTASPKFLRAFLREPGVKPRELPDSGRSMQSIIDLANYLVEWTRDNHPVDELRDAFAPTYIQPTAPGDPQPNPPDDPSKVYLYDRKLTSERELAIVADSLKEWVAENPDKTVAALAPRNERGNQLVAELKKRGVPYKEILQSTQSTRETAEVLNLVLDCLSSPNSPTVLSNLFPVWVRLMRSGEADQQVETVRKVMRNWRRVENYLWPAPGQDILESELTADLTPEAIQEMGLFRETVQRWQAAVLLPIDQLILTLAQDLFTQPAELALAHKLAVVLRSESDSHPGWSLADLAEELRRIAQNQRKFFGFGAEDTGFKPDDYKGQVVVSTIHKAKGLEWDRVYLMSVNNYDFPSAQPQDYYIAEPYYIRGRMNLQAEVVEQLMALLRHDAVGMNVVEGLATMNSRYDYSAERLRLLYVGITRAREELILTWNSGQRGDSQPAIPLIALATYWKEKTSPG